MKYRQWVITFWDMTQIRHYHNKWNFSIDGCRYNALQKKQMDCTLAYSPFTFIFDSGSRCLPYLGKLEVVGTSNTEVTPTTTIETSFFIVVANEILTVKHYTKHWSIVSRE